LPIYEYECESCATVTDIKHGFKETPSEVCPKCGGHLKRVFNAAGIVFKGSGFYVNDSRTSSAAAATSSPKTGEAKSAEAKSGETKTETAGASKPADTGPKSDGGGKSDAAA